MFYVESRGRKRKVLPARLVDPPRGKARMAWVVANAAKLTLREMGALLGIARQNVHRILERSRNLEHEPYYGVSGRPRKSA